VLLVREMDRESENPERALLFTQQTVQT